MGRLGFGGDCEGYSLRHFSPLFPLAPHVEPLSETRDIVLYYSMDHNANEVAQHIGKLGLHHGGKTLCLHVARWGIDFSDWCVEYRDIGTDNWRTVPDGLFNLIMDSTECDHDLLHVLTACLGMGTADALGICLSTAQ